MTRSRYLFALTLVSLVSTPAFSQGPANAAVSPLDRSHESWWLERHKLALEAAHAHPDTQLLLIGDSITNNYEKSKLPDENFQPTWNAFYAPRQALNLGFSGDTTANVLWRLDHGEVEGLHPKAVILLIGTNNTGHAKQTAEQTETGIDAVIADLEQRLPAAHIILVGILPSDISPEKSAADDAVNRYLASSYGEHPRVTYLDIGSIFFADGKLNTQIFYDPRLPQHGKALHPDTDGQARMAQAIEPAVAKAMGDAPRVPLASMTDINTAVLPVPWLEQDSYDWYARHHAELALQKTLHPKVVLVGDSITHFWAGPPNAHHVNGTVAWQHLFANMPVLNMGFGWDRTQNVLWRLRQGEFDNLHPEWVVVNIGTNNLAATNHARANTPPEIASGIEAIIRVLHERSPESHIVLMAIFPRGASPEARFRAPIIETNRLLGERFAKDPAVTFVDIGRQFLSSDGSLPPSLMPDGTHPSDAGYQLWADALIRVGIKP